MKKLFALLVLVTACAPDDESTQTTNGDDPATYEEDTSSADALALNHTVQSLTPTTTTVDARTLDADIAPLHGYGTTPLAAGSTVVVLRHVRIDGTDAAVVVDVATAITTLVAATALDESAHAEAAPVGPWLEAHAEHEDAFATLVTPKTDTGAQRMTLTLDMCQSSHAWEKRFYDELSSLGTKLGKPLPIGVAMTGGWARGHSSDLADLRRRNGDTLAIEWVNHSNTHPLHCTDASQRHCAFLTDPSVDMASEVLGLEKVLLGLGEVPGALFRFPGLTHDARTLGAVHDLGLFSLDADAWLAKGQLPHPGAVILVHGNGNEVPGIQKATTWLHDHHAELVAGSIVLVPPRAVVVP